MEKTIRNFRAVLLLIFALNIYFSAPDIRLSYAESEPRDASRIERMFLEGSYQQVVNETDRLIDLRSSLRDELYYLKGLSELKLNKFGDSRKSFENLISKYPSSKMVFDAHLGIGDSYFLEGNFDNAVKAYNDMLAKFPNDRNAAILYYRIGSCYAKRGSGDTAAHYFDKAKREAPLSFEKNLALAQAAVREPAKREAPKEADLRPTEIPRTEKPGPFSVQVGCFKNRRNAEKLALKLFRAGYKSYVGLPVGSRDKLYRVRVGRLNTTEETEGLASKLRKEGYSTKICTDDICR